MSALREITLPKTRTLERRVLYPYPEDIEVESAAIRVREDPHTDDAFPLRLQCRLHGREHVNLAVARRCF